MKEPIATVSILVDGMSCAQCEQRIEKAVSALAGVREVRASAPLSEVTVTYDPGCLEPSAIDEAIRAAGYLVREVPAGQASEASTPRRTPMQRAITAILGLLAIVAAAYLIVRFAGGLTWLPAVSQSMGYGLLFVVGLLTSLHCIAMCGGIVLSQGVKADAPGRSCTDDGLPRFREKLLPSLLYNGGRVVSYTLIGGIVGALGSLFSLSTALKGLMPAVAGLFMLFLGVRMLGIFPRLSRLQVRLPGGPGARVSRAMSRRGPFAVGLLNGLMPCGPLQTMQVYALGTGSLLTGALSMFLFSLGTVPLLLGFGAISALLSARFNRGMLKASGALVMILGLVMFARGMNLFGVALPAIAEGPSSTEAVARIVNGAQEVRTTVESDAYHPLVVQIGIPVRWTVNVREDQLNGCNSPLTVPPYGIRKELVPGDNLIEFTPDREGTITYTCWMGMISSTIRVVRDLKAVQPADLAYPATGSAAAAGGCCGQ